MTTQDTTTSAGTATGVYAYAFVAAAGVLPAGLSGVGPDAGPVDVVRRGELGLLVSDVDTERLGRLYDEDLSEQSELATWAQDHDRVVRAAFDRGPVLPFRFGTVLLDRPAADRLLADQYDTALSMLAHVRDRVEWGVRVHGDVGGRPTDAGGDRSSGAAYLASRRKRLDERDQRRDQARDTAAAIADELTASIVDVARRSSREALLDVAVLVDRSGEEEFLATAERLAARAADAGLELRVTGPWPPYSFARTALEVGDG